MRIGRRPARRGGFLTRMGETPVKRHTSVRRREGAWPAVWIAGLALLLPATFARAAADFWDGNGTSPPNGFWGTGNNWGDDSTPGNGDTATFNIANTYAVTFNANPLAIQALTNSAGIVTFASSGGTRILLVNSASGGQDVTVNGGATLSLGTSGNPLHLTVGDDLAVNNNGTLNVSFGSQVNTLDLLLATTGANTGGTIVVDGTGSALNRTGTDQTTLGLTSNTASLAYRNNATGDIDGTLQVLNSPVGAGSASLNVESGAHLELDSLRVGDAGASPGRTGTVTVTGGNSLITQTGSSTLTVGRTAAGGNVGILSVNSSGVFTTGTGAIAVNTTGTINVAGGTLNANGSLTMSNGGNLTINGGTLNANSGFNNSAGGTLNLYNGELAVGGGAFAPNAGGAFTLNGQSPADLPHLRLTGGATSTLGNAIVIASSNKAKLTIEGGANLSATAQTATIGNSAGSQGEVVVSGDGSSWTIGSLSVGVVGTGTLNIQNNASVYVANSLSINNLSNVNLSGGSLRFDTIGGTGGLSRLNYSSGTIRLQGSRDFFTDPTIATLFGNAPTISAGKKLITEGNSTISFGTLSDVVRINGGSLQANGDVIVGVSGVPGSVGNLEIINGGTVNCNAMNIGYTFFEDDFFNDGVVRVSGSGSSLTATDHITLGRRFVAGDPLAKSYVGSLTVEDGALVDVKTLIMDDEGTVNINGGTIRIDELQSVLLQGTHGEINFNAGKLALRGDRTIGIDPIIDRVLGGAPSLTTAKELAIEETATLVTVVTLNGGILSAKAISGTSNLRLQHGTLNVTNQAMTVGAAGSLGATLDLAADMSVNVTLGITNQGLVSGDGEIGGPFANAAAGELRANPGNSLTLKGVGNSNAGRIRLLGGSLDFKSDLTNAAGGFISGNGSLLTGGLTNHGTMNFAGTANIAGNVTNSATGRIISGGGGATIFYDDVVNNGEIRTSTNGFTVFYGSVSGGGTFTGTGTVNFEGDLSPGSSPATVDFGGDVALGPDSKLRIELGGTNPATDFDRINVAGKLSLDGALEISLINGFVPTAGQTFDFLVGSNVVGAFSSIQLPTVPGLTWNTSQLLTGVLSVVAGIPGDYNQDGRVDAADYTVWRDHLATGQPLPNDDSPGVGPDDYTRWKTNFGQHSGSGTGALAGVPEPSAQLTACATMFAVLVRRWGRKNSC
jgi:T5SS/PEP-CTERM-associated repeat protein